MSDILKSAQSGKKVRGQAFLIKHLKGGKLTRSQALQAHCYDCNGMGESRECDAVDCSLYPYSQFKIAPVAPSDAPALPKAKSRGVSQ